MSQFSRFKYGSVEFTHAYPKLAELDPTGFSQPNPVKARHLPALRALVKKQFSNLSNHEQNTIVEEARGHLGGIFEGGTSAADNLLKTIFGTENVPTYGTLEDYSNAVNILSRNGTVKDYLNYFKDSAFRKQVKGSVGYDKSTTMDNLNVGSKTTPSIPGGGKQTLSSRYVQPGTSSLDVPIPKKVESQVSADMFNYLAANPENGMYNAMYLNDKQWEQEVRYKSDDFEMPTEYDQRYFQSFKIPHEYRVKNPEYELMDRFERDFYAIMAKNDPTQNPLKDVRWHYEPIMGEMRRNQMEPEITLIADGIFPYPDPDNNGTYSADINRLGFRPFYDPMIEPYRPSPFIPTPILNARQQLKMYDESGFASFSST